MNDFQPSVSIIIPVYNRETVIQDTLDSVYSQTHTNWECIIVDDGSIDNTVDIIQSYCNKDIRFKLYKRNIIPKGAPTCRNIGFTNAIGDYILLLDSDDILAPDFIEKQVNILIHSRFGASISKILRFQDSINVSVKWYTNNKDISLEGFLNSECTWRTSCVLWKREAINKIGKFNTNLRAFQDWLMYIKHFSYNDSFEVNNQTCLYYRENWSEHQISNKSDVITYAYYLSRKLAFITLFKKIISDKVIRKSFLKAYSIDYNLFNKKLDILTISLIYLILNRNIKDFIKAQLLLIKMLVK